MDYDKLLSLAVDLGCCLMSSGAEIYRVEESMKRILDAYRLDGAEVFAIPNCIIVSATVPDGRSLTRMRRVGAHGTDLELLRLCNHLCRAFCAETPPPEEALEQLKAAMSRHRRFSHQQVLLGYGIAPMFFAPLFGGGPSDMFCALLVGLLLGLLEIYGRQLLGSNSFFRTVVSSASASLASIVLVQTGIGGSVDTITISALMMLVPGIALTNAMREIMAGDTVSALNHAADALLCAVAIALGSSVGIAILRPY